MKVVIFLTGCYFFITAFFLPLVVKDSTEIYGNNNNNIDIERCSYKPKSYFATVFYYGTYAFIKPLCFVLDTRNYK